MKEIEIDEYGNIVSMPRLDSIAAPLDKNSTSKFVSNYLESVLFMTRCQKCRNVKNVEMSKP